MHASLGFMVYNNHTCPWVHPQSQVVIDHKSQATMHYLLLILPIVLLYSNSSSKCGELLFTVIANSQTTAEIPEVIAQELRILSLNLLSKPQRYGKYVDYISLLRMFWLK